MNRQTITRVDHFHTPWGLPFPYVAMLDWRIIINNDTGFVHHQQNG